MGNEANVSIVGAGLAGLAAAIALAGQGRKVTLYERAAKFEEVGAGLQLGPNAVRALQTIGAWDAVEPITYAPPAIRMHNGGSGRLLKEIDLSLFERRYGQPYRVAHRADLHAALVAVAAANRNIEILLGQEVDAATLDGEVIAADGVRSATRVKLFPGSEALTTNDAIYRALVPMLPRIDANVNLWMFPSGHVVHYPVANNLNLVAVTQGASPSVHFTKAHFSLKSVLDLAGDWTSWPGACVPALPSWQKNNITLIGDAAHGTLPFLAQGAAMALEDAAELVTSKNWAARQARTQRLHGATLEAGKTYHLSGLYALARDGVIAVLPSQSILNRLDWIYGMTRPGGLPPPP